MGAVNVNDDLELQRLLRGVYHFEKRFLKEARRWHAERQEAWRDEVLAHYVAAHVEAEVGEAARPLVPSNRALYGQKRALNLRSRELNVVTRDIRACGHALRRRASLLTEVAADDGATEPAKEMRTLTVQALRLLGEVASALQRELDAAGAPAPNPNPNPNPSPSPPRTPTQAQADDAAAATPSTRQPVYHHQRAQPQPQQRRRYDSRYFPSASTVNVMAPASGADANPTPPAFPSAYASLAQASSAACLPTSRAVAAESRGLGLFGSPPAPHHGDSGERLAARRRRRAIREGRAREPGLLGEYVASYLADQTRLRQQLVEVERHRREMSRIFQPEAGDQFR
mmetsp:Transcript_7003/g.20451  ORF Transcript_7003/g.20451 Transcript_7003/m.20451 type:complete len:342 (-) Transcript_7003:133-1158(-)